MYMTKHEQRCLLVADGHVVHDNAVVQLGHDADLAVAADAALLDRDGLLGRDVAAALADQAHLLLQHGGEARPGSALAVLVQDDVPSCSTVNNKSELVIYIVCPTRTGFKCCGKCIP